MTRRPLRVHVITEEDPFYLPVFFREFLERLPRDRFAVTGIDITPPLNQKTHLALARKLYRFYGTVDFLRLAGRYAAARVRDLLLPKDQWFGTVARIAAHHGVPSAPVAQVNARAYVDRLRALEIDLLISVAASQIFKQDLIAVPRLAAINIHTGALPMYRGMLPVFWQMYEGEASIGITIHTLTTDIDLGDIVLFREVPLSNDQNLDLVIRKMKSYGAQAMIEVLERYHDGSVAPRPMDRSQEGYRSFPKRREAQAFRRLGYRLL